MQEVGYVFNIFFATVNEWYSELSVHSYYFTLALSVTVVTVLNNHPKLQF